MKPNWVINETKYNIAKTNAKNVSDEQEIKALYVSYGGLLAKEDEVVLQEVNEKIEMPEEEKIEEVIETPIVEEIVPEAIVEEDITPVEEEITE